MSFGACCPTAVRRPNSPISPSNRPASGVRLARANAAQRVEAAARTESGLALVGVVDHGKRPFGPGW